MPLVLLLARIHTVGSWGMAQGEASEKQATPTLTLFRSTCMCACMVTQPPLSPSSALHAVAVMHKHTLKQRGRSSYGGEKLTCVPIVCA